MKSGSFYKLPVVALFLGTALWWTPSRAETDRTTPSRSPELSIKTVRIEVPFIKQEEPRDCGLAVLKMLMGFYGQKLDQAQVDWVKENSNAGQGTAASELVTVLNAAEYETALYKGTLDEGFTGVYRQLDQKRPLIVMVTSKDGKSSHYDIVTGYDPIRSYILLMDPAIGPITLSNNDFQTLWKKANSLTLMAVPKKLLLKPTRVK